MHQAVLVFPVSESEVLLAKKTSKVGAGRLNGYGGKIEYGETPVEAACREFAEESGGASVRPQDLALVGLGIFRNTESDGSVSVWEVHIFLAKAWFGHVRSTTSMSDPRWVDFRLVEKLPFHLLLPGDRVWLPKILRDKEYYMQYPLRISVHYGPGQRELLRQVDFGVMGWSV